jgi:hypothetical protein
VRTAAQSRQAGGHWFEPSTAHLDSLRNAGVFVFSGGPSACGTECAQPLWNLASAGNVASCDARPATPKPTYRLATWSPRCYWPQPPWVCRALSPTRQSRATAAQAGTSATAWSSATVGSTFGSRRPRTTSAATHCASDCFRRGLLPKTRCAAAPSRSFAARSAPGSRQSTTHASIRSPSLAGTV